MSIYSRVSGYFDKGSPAAKAAVDGFRAACRGEDTITIFGQEIQYYTGFHLVKINGNPFLYKGDGLYDLEKNSLGNADAYLKEMAASKAATPPEEPEEMFSVWAVGPQCTLSTGHTGKLTSPKFSGTSLEGTVNDLHHWMRAECPGISEYAVAWCTNLDPTEKCGSWFVAWSEDLYGNCTPCVEGPNLQALVKIIKSRPGQCGADILWRSSLSPATQRYVEEASVEESNNNVLVVYKVMGYKPLTRQASDIYTSTHLRKLEELVADELDCKVEEVDMYYRWAGPADWPDYTEWTSKRPE